MPKTTPMCIKSAIPTNRKRNIDTSKNFLKLKKCKNQYTNTEDDTEYVVLYRYVNGYLLFELNQAFEPLRIWRDLQHGRFPVKCSYLNIAQFSLKIKQLQPTIVFANDLEPINTMFDYLEKPRFEIRPFFVPFQEFLEQLRFGYLQKTAQQTEFSDTVSTTATQPPKYPTYKSVKKLVTNLTYDEYVSIYCV